jgi:hypothetical protein
LLRGPVDAGLVEAAHLGMESSCQSDERERERSAAGFAEAQA